MNAWTTLGLERTGDVAEIRRAYARRLKATDVDADPDAFIALREALNRALAEAAREAAALDDDLYDGGDFDAPFPEPPPPEPVADEAAGPADTRYVDLERLLFAGEDAPPPDPDALVAAVRAVLDHPDMEHVDRSVRIEHWLAEILYHAIPRSDPVLAMVVDHFRWDRGAGQWDQPWLLDELVRRREAFGMLDRLADPRHDWHKAYLDLISDRPTLGWNTMAHANKVGMLLMTIRQDAPAAEYYLSPHRVALWDEKLGKSVTGGLKWAMVGFWLLFIAAKIFVAVGGDTTPSTTSAPLPLVSGLTDPDLDIDPVLGEAYDWRLNLAGLATSNPALHARLTDQWREARDARTRAYTFENDIRTLVRQAASEGLRGGDYQLQSDWWRLRADELGWLREQNVEACNRSLQGMTYTPRLPLNFGDRRRDLELRALTSVPDNPPPVLPPGETYSYEIPGTVFADAARRAALDPDTMGAALDENGGSPHLCAAKIALIEATLAAPRAQGRRLLRDLSRGL